MQHSTINKSVVVHAHHLLYSSIRSISTGRGASSAAALLGSIGIKNNNHSNSVVKTALPVPLVQPATHKTGAVSNGQQWWSQVRQFCTSPNASADTPMDPAKRQAIRDKLKAESKKNGGKLLLDSEDRIRVGMEMFCEGLNKLKVVGLDCEWIPRDHSDIGTIIEDAEKAAKDTGDEILLDNIQKNRVALLQLSNKAGLCLMIRLCRLKTVPAEVAKFLEDDTVLKVGVGIHGDVKRLAQDWELKVVSYVDTRFLFYRLFSDTKEAVTRMRLTDLCEKLMGFTMIKETALVISNWCALQLTPNQIRYAATDAHVSLDTFVESAKRIQALRDPANKSLTNDLMMEFTKPFHNIGYQKPSKGAMEKLAPAGGEGASSTASTPAAPAAQVMPKKRQTRAASAPATGMKPPAASATPPAAAAAGTTTNNYVMQTAKGPISVQQQAQNILNSINRKRTKYTIDSTLVPPFTPPEPPKPNFPDNPCYVCGNEAMITKHLVPEIYFRHFPEENKKESYYDTVKLCFNCLKTADRYERETTRRLAVVYETQLDELPSYEAGDMEEIECVRIARALKDSEAKLSDERRQEWTKKLTDFAQSNPKYSGHGQSETIDKLAEAHIGFTVVPAVRQANRKLGHATVVTEHKAKERGGLLGFERYWRNDFVSSMRPKFLPEMWGRKW